MEKQIKMSLESARILYDQLSRSTEQESSHEDRINCNKAVKELLENIREGFTKEELEGNKGYTWEESFSGEGWFIGIDGFIYNKNILTPHQINKIYFRKKEQAESALAFAQLSHIVARYNQDKFAITEDGMTIHYYIQAYNNDTLKVVKTTYLSMMLPRQPFLFCAPVDAETSLEVNKKLWRQYYMINDEFNKVD